MLPSVAAEHPHQGFLTSTLASAGSGISWVFYSLWTNGPGWALVPPILLSIASLYGAIATSRKMRQDMRFAEDLHRARLDRVRLGVERLDSAN